MAEDVLQKCVAAGLLSGKPAGVTNQLPLVGTPQEALRHRISDAPGLHSYGSDAPTVQALPGAGEDLGGGLTVAMVRFGARFEYARTVEDVLARRTRALFLNAHAAEAMAPAVSRLMGKELEWDAARVARETDAFVALARGYQVSR